MLLLQVFTFTIIVRPRKSHVITDQLSRIKLGELLEGVNGDFLDIHLFQIAVLPPGYENIGEYLSTCSFSREMRLGQRRKLSVKRNFFQLINGLL